MPLSKSAAIREARGYVTIAKSSPTSYHVFGPYRVNDLSGPSTELTVNSRQKAVAEQAAWRAQIALQLMGRLTDAAYSEIERCAHHPYEPHDLPGLVQAGLDAK